jgi:hypothetical protein
VPADDNINSFVRNDDASEFSSEAIYANKLLMIGLSYYYRIIVIYGCFHRLKYNIFYEVMRLQSFLCKSYDGESATKIRCRWHSYSCASRWAAGTVIRKHHFSFLKISNIKVHPQARYSLLRAYYSCKNVAAVGILEPLKVARQRVVIHSLYALAALRTFRHAHAVLHRLVAQNRAYLPKAGKL